MEFPAQVVVTSRLNRELHSSLRILTDHADIEDIERFLAESKDRIGQGERNNIDAVLQASMSANRMIYAQVRGDEDMCEAMEELMKDIIEKRVEERLEARVEECLEERVDITKIEDIKSIVNSFKISVEQAMDALNIPTEQRLKLLEKI